MHHADPTAARHGGVTARGQLDSVGRGLIRWFEGLRLGGGTSVGHRKERVAKLARVDSEAVVPAGILRTEDRREHWQRDPGWLAVTGVLAAPDRATRVSTLSDAKLRRAGLDYHDLASVNRANPSFAAFLAAGGWSPAGRRACSRSPRRPRWGYTSVAYVPGDVLLFGPEPEGAACVRPSLMRPVTEQVTDPDAARPPLAEPRQRPPRSPSTKPGANTTFVGG